MEKVDVRVIGRPYRRSPVGEVLSVSRQDARVLTALGRVELVGPPKPFVRPSRPAVAKTPAKRNSAPRKPKTK